MESGDRTVRTQRLILRRWRDDDLAPYAALNADPRVMAHFPSVLSREESDAQAGRIRKHWDDQGFGLWAVEVAGGAPFIGFIGLQRVPFEAAFTPAVEVGWRLAFDAWGHGYATEGARAALALGFGALGLREIVSMTVTSNERSWHVMEKLGMRRAHGEDFDHPRLPEGHPLRRHILYRLAAAAGVAVAS
ncbi:MAG TPA: GNAT family N-acetyltransferase [Polyangiaceae bacterium]